MGARVQAALWVNGAAAHPLLLSINHRLMDATTLAADSMYKLYRLTLDSLVEDHINLRVTRDD